MHEQELKAAGIDYDAALERFVGNAMLYERFLKKFIDDKHAEDARKAYEKRDYADLLEQVHALKGVAGTLGMGALYETSAELVDVLRNGKQENLEEMLERIEAEHGKMIQVLQNK